MDEDLNHRRIALLTGPSCSGKSTLASRFGVPTLNGDEALACGFSKLGRPDLANYILFLSHWAPLRPAIDQHYVDYVKKWMSEQVSPPRILAEAWIFAFQDWRSFLLEAITEQCPGYEYRLFVLDPPYEDYRRYRNLRLKELSMPENERQTRNFFDEFYRDLEWDDGHSYRGEPENVANAMEVWLQSD